MRLKMALIIMSSTIPVDSLAEKIRRYLQLQNVSALRRLLARQNFADIAEVMENSLNREEAVTCFQYLSVGLAGQVLNSLNEDLQQLFLSSLPAMMGGQILHNMPVDDAVDIL